MKICTKCNQELDEENFSKHKNGKNGLRSDCKACNNTYSKKYHEDHLEQIRSRKKGYQIGHYYRNKAQYYFRNSIRRAQKLQATPKWADLNAIKEVYEEAIYFNYHVDHIYPLMGKEVCGLHVWENLQIIPAEENLRKGNRV